MYKRQIEQLSIDYALKNRRSHVIQQLLRAYTFFEKDSEYIITDDAVKMVDEQTGRVVEGHLFPNGLHQAIEAKEHLKVSEMTQTYASITIQNYFLSLIHISEPTRPY